MLGYGDRIVATTATIKSIPLFKRFVPSISRAVYCFGSNEFNQEELLKATPEVLFIPEGSYGKFEHLNAMGITVVSFKSNSLRAIVDRTVITGEVLGPDAHQKALRYQEYFNGNVERVRKVVAGIPREKRVRLYHSMGNPLSTAGKNSLVQDWMDMAGAINVAENWFVGAKAGTVSPEQIISSDPDAILVMNASAADEIRKDVKWATVKAVRNNRIYVNPRGMFWWCRETSEEALQFLWLAKTLYPDYFQSIDMKKETKYFYKTFYGYDLTESEIHSILNPT
jgi:iron complex transport system substrate-binding protein